MERSQLAILRGEVKQRSARFNFFSSLKNSVLSQKRYGNLIEFANTTRISSFSRHKYLCRTEARDQCVAENERETLKAIDKIGRKTMPEETETKTLDETTEHASESESESLQSEQEQESVIAPQPELKHDWYQSDTIVTVSVHVKNLTEDDVRIEMSENRVRVHIDVKSDPDREFSTSLDFPLWQSIQPQLSSYLIKPVKIELKLRKLYETKWESLTNGSDDNLKTQKQVQAFSTEKWTKWEVELEKKKDKDEEPEEGHLNALFRKVYGDGNEDTRRSMMKSFIESKGTVLSTNWKETGDKYVEMKPPDNMEWKKWD